jgi:hypothetical protein
MSGTESRIQRFHRFGCSPARKKTDPVHSYGSNRLQGAVFRDFASFTPKRVDTPRASTKVEKIYGTSFFTYFLKIHGFSF